MEKMNCYTQYDDKKKEELENLNKQYLRFLSECKTERECVKEIVKQAKEFGFRDIEDIIKNGERVTPGDKIYGVYMKKAVVLFQIGNNKLSHGINVLGAHNDSPRMDIKQNPLFEDSELVFLDTHYYGGIKKYQWVTLPLALHGTVVKKNGVSIDIKIGEKEDEPVFCVTDLLVHLAQEQLEKKASTVIEGENLNILFGSIPVDTEEKERAKANVLTILKEQYDIDEDDFISAEIEVVPAGNARELGIDRSMIMSYGQDDRACVFAALKSIFEVGQTEKTICCIFVDKEEIGSVGATGMQSKFFEGFLAEIMNLVGEYSEINLRRVFRNSKMLSSDVSPAFDPTYASVFERKNSAFLSHGMVFNKFTGGSGKSGSNDANAEYVAELRRIMDDNGVNYQTAELGRVDCGGGGTIAYILAQYGMEVIDCGVPVLNMHAPWEVTSKVDIYEAYKGYIAFLKNA